MKPVFLLLLTLAPALAEPQAKPVMRIDQTLALPAPLGKELEGKLATDRKLHVDTPENTRGKAWWRCTVGLMTDVLVSWRCMGATEDGAKLGVHRTFAIRDGKAIAFELAPELGAREAFLELARRACPAAADPTKLGMFVSSNGIELFASDDAQTGCQLSWAALYRLLKPAGLLATAARSTVTTGWQRAFAEQLAPGQKLPAAKKGKTPPNRFVAEGDWGVRDTQTGLLWAAHPPPDEVDLAGASAAASDFRGGGHADWRLPTIGELATLATPDLAHAEPGDCTDGASQYTITPLIHLSCGLAWSLSATKDRTAAFGFISGTARLAKPDERKNFRAVLVRAPD